jgi:hypothetical protein
MIRFRLSETIAPPPQSCGRKLVDRMADDMREMAFAGETVSLETLIQRGYPLAVVRRLSTRAIGIARRASVRHV